MSPATDLPATDARVRRAERVAVVQALPELALDWAAIDACPAWVARSEPERELLSAHAGAWWLAASLRACIDGKRLTRVCEMLGEPRLNALRDTPNIARAEALARRPHLCCRRPTRCPATCWPVGAPCWAGACPAACAARCWPPWAGPRTKATTLFLMRTPTMRSRRWMPR